MLFTPFPNIALTFVFRLYRWRCSDFSILIIVLPATVHSRKPQLHGPTGFVCVCVRERESSHGGKEEEDERKMKKKNAQEITLPHDRDFNWPLPT